MLEYIVAHWRGELSLPRSYWVNGVLLNIAIVMGSALSEPATYNLHLETMAVIALAMIGLSGAIALWQIVGIWRSATKTAINTRRAFWPVVAKVVTVLGMIAGAAHATTATTDLVKILVELQDPSMSEYTLEVLGGTDLIMTGAINEDSADEAIAMLGDPAISVLRIRSHGSMGPSATRS